VTYHRSPSGRQGYVSWKDPTDVIDIEDCPIAQKELNDLWRTVREAFRSFSAEEVPFIVLRRSSTGEQAIIVSITATHLFDRIRKVASSINGVVAAYATHIEPKGYSPFGKELLHLHGATTITESFGNVRYLVRPDLFFQIHPEITEEMVARVRHWANDSGVTEILDLFCGAGLFSLALARNGIRAMGVEVSHHAVASAQDSARANGLDNLARFRAGKAHTIVQRLVREGGRWNAAIVDPPRKGLQPDVLNTLPQLGIRHLLYVSCSPATMARDFKALALLGYKVLWLKPFDMFPQTYHVEIMAALEKQ
jgi:23S rRNA (uracil1939-C5)-methyltransferase